MTYNEYNSHPALRHHIDAFWKVEGTGFKQKKIPILPDGCVDLIFNLGSSCQTGNNTFTMQYGKAYLVGTMTAAQYSLMESQHVLIGARFKPGAFASFFNYAPLHEVTDATVEFEQPFSPDLDKLSQCGVPYLNGFFLKRFAPKEHYLSPVLRDINMSGGQLTVRELSKRNFIPVRQLERRFRNFVGISPKEYSNIVRFRSVLEKIRQNNGQQSFLQIAFESGYYDHAHLANDLKRFTGLAPSQL